MEVASVLVHAGRALAVLHGLLVGTSPWLHADLGGNHVLGCVLHILACFTALGELGVVDCFLVAELRAWATVHQRHVGHAGCNLAHLRHWANLVTRAGSLV